MDDLNPDNVGLVAYWNVLEQGGLPPSELDWSEVLQNSRIIDYVPYDNGLIINWNSDSGQHPGHYVRLKTDGWMIAYTRTDVEGSYDGTNAEDKSDIDYNVSYESYPMSDAPTTLCSLSPGWWDYRSGSVRSIDRNRLAASISSLVSDLSNSDNIDFSYSSVGLFDFIFGADTYSLFGMDNEGGSQSAEANILSDSTTIHACHTAGGTAYNGSDDSKAEIYVNGNKELEAGALDPGYFTKDFSAFFAQEGTISMELRGANGEGGRGVIVIPWSDS